MNRFRHIEAFARVVETGGFASAGRALGISRSAVSKYVGQLESRLGARLLHRSTRQVSPTDAGQAYYARCAAILAELQEADQAVAQLHQSPRGTLRINAPMSFGTAYVGPAVADFMADYPDLRVELTLNDRFVDPVEEGFDVTIRIADLADSSLIGRRIAGVRRVLCAAPAYLRSHGAPAHPDELRTHRWLSYGYLAGGNRWRLEGPAGAHTVRIDGVLCSNNGEVLRAGALRGLGIAMLPVFLLEDALRTGALKAILTDYSAPPLSVYLLYPPGRNPSAKMRLFGDFMAERFRGRTAWAAA